MTSKLRCNDRDRAEGRSMFLTCLECGIGPCKLPTGAGASASESSAKVTAACEEGSIPSTGSTPTKISPASDAQISEWEYEAEQPHPNHQDWRILQLCARIKAEREKAGKFHKALQPFLLAAEDIDDDAEDRWDIWNSPVAMNITIGVLRQVLALLTNKGGKPS